MSNVVALAPRIPKVPSPQTRWDKLAAQSEIGLVSYRIHVVLMTASWCFQTGRIKQGDDFIRACHEQGFDSRIDLGKELGDLMEIADRSAAVMGTLSEPEADQTGDAV